MLSKPRVFQIGRKAICPVGYGNSKTEDTQGPIIHEETNVPGQVRHCVKGVGGSTGQGKDDAHKHVSQERPGVAVVFKVESLGKVTQDPEEIAGGQEMGPEVEGLIGSIKNTEDTLEGGALGVAITTDDEVLVEMLRHLMDLVCGARQPY